MSATTLFIIRPVTTILLMSGLLVFGMLGYLTLPVSDLPPVEYPTITVSAALPGANPDTMASTVATPLERQFSTIAGVETMYSNSYLGRTNITLQFVLERNIDAAAQDVQAAISQAARSLPPDMPAPPAYNKVNPADQPVLFMSLKSATHPAVGGGRIRADDARAAVLHGQRCRAGHDLRIAEIRRSHPGGSEQAGGARHRH